MGGGPQREFDGQWFTDAQPGYYDRVFKAGRGVQWFWHQYRFQAVVDYLPTAGESILDLGCGPGTFLGQFSSGFQRGLGIDLSQAQIDYCRSTYGSDRLHFEKADIATFNSSELFDAIISIEVIEHLPAEETQDFLGSILRLLKPGGVLVLTTPNYRSCWPLIEWLVSKIGAIDYRQQHINPFNLSRISAEIEKAGFERIRTHSFFVVSPFLAAVSSRIARWVCKYELKFVPQLGSEIVIACNRP